jgi:hypothetical protein
VCKQTLSFAQLYSASKGTDNKGADMNSQFLMTILLLLVAVASAQNFVCYFDSAIILYPSPCRKLMVVVTYQRMLWMLKILRLITIPLLLKELVLITSL